MRQILCAVIFISVGILPVTLLGQKGIESKATPTNEAAKANEERLLTRRRSFMVSQVISLADEARRFDDKSLRPHVLAMAANTLWITDRDTTGLLFYRAWDAAELADAEVKPPPGLQAAGGATPFVVPRRVMGLDARLEVIRLAAGRDRKLGDELLKKLTAANERNSSSAGIDSSNRTQYDSLLGTDEVVKRLEVARSLLHEGQIDQAIEFAKPALVLVNRSSINFLTTLRTMRSAAADGLFAALLAGAEADPTSDANTVSGLSSYLFTPRAYITYSPEGLPMWDLQGSAPLPPPTLPATRQRFFQVAAEILTRPLAPPGEDHTTSGRAGKYMVIKRLLPLFNQYAPDLAGSLFSQLTSLSGEVSQKTQDSDSLLDWNLRPQPDPADTLKTRQDKLDHAKSTQERDVIYENAAITLSTKADPRARDIAKEIDDESLRDQVLTYVDFALVQSAINRQKAEEVMQLAKTGQLSHIQKVWASVEASRLLIKTDKARAVSILEGAAAEARRIDANDPDRARGLMAVATEIASVDSEHAWEILAEGIKAANSAEEFDPENAGIIATIWTKEGPKIKRATADNFSLRPIFRLLSKNELERSLEVAKTFKGERARAIAILTVADATLSSSVMRTVQSAK